MFNIKKAFKTIKLFVFSVLHTTFCGTCLIYTVAHLVWLIPFLLARTIAPHLLPLLLIARSSGLLTLALAMYALSLSHHASEAACVGEDLGVWIL